MLAGNSNYPLSRDTRLKMAGVSWPLLLTDREILFLESFTDAYTSSLLIKKSSQFDWQEKRRVDAPNHKNLSVSLFGYNLSGEEYIFHQAAPLLYRVISIKKIPTQEILTQFLHTFSVTESSTLYLLMAASLQERYEVVTTDLVRQEIATFLSASNYDNTTMDQLYYFKKYFLGIRNEKMIIPTSEKLLAMQTKKAVFSERGHPWFDSFFFLAN